MRAGVSIPPRMRHLPLDPRGYPIPHGIYVDSVTKRPHFTVNDEAVRQQTIREDICAICGSKLFRARWSVGGPLSAFHPQGSYIDPPMHLECMTYALQVCPYLAAPNYARRIDESTMTDEEKFRAGVISDPTMIPTRPKVFVAIMHVGQKLISKTPGMVNYIKPNKPFRQTQYWSKGQRLPDKEGYELAMLEVESYVK